MTDEEVEAALEDAAMMIVQSFLPCISDDANLGFIRGVAREVTWCVNERLAGCNG
jgi:hypothetical protein